MAQTAIAASIRTASLAGLTPIPNRPIWTQMWREGKMDISWISQEDEDNLPEYYLNLEEDPESVDENEDYKESSLSLIDGMEERFRRSVPMFFSSCPSPLFTLLTWRTCRYCRYVRKEPDVAMRDLTPYTIKSCSTFSVYSCIQRVCVWPHVPWKLPVLSRNVPTFQLYQHASSGVRNIS